MMVKDVMAPMPSSDTGVQLRSWHAGQNSFGGIASSPHLPQRMPVKRPALASSKKCFSVITRSATAEEAHEDGGGIAAEARPALLGRGASPARLEESQAFGRDDLGDREAVV